MILIVGLGNPGKKYVNTRHNLGFQVIDKFFKNRGMSNFFDFKFEKKFLSLISKGKLNNKKIILAKPQTFMNLSGKAVKSLITHYLPKERQIQAMARILRQFDNLWVMHDDIDLSLGKIRIAIGQGAAGHKGVESIIKELNSKNFVRFRIGIQSKTGKPKNSEKFVLQKFTKEEEKVVKEVIKKTIEAIEFSLKKGLEKAMNRYNK